MEMKERAPMKRKTRLRLLAVLFCALVGLNLATLVLAAPMQQEIRAIITSPRMNAVVRGRVQITGSALHTDFQFYKIELSSPATPEQWSIIKDLIYNQVVEGVLAIWDTTRIPDGTYSLRLRVVDNTGNYAEHIVPQVVVANTQPTETPTPTPTLTPTSSPPPILTPTIIVGWLTPTEALSPTPTSILTTPTAAAPATATPTRIPGSTLIPTQTRFSINMAAMGRAFLVGAGLSGSLFVLLGIFALLRRFIG